jgi:hypothetical protein
LSEASSSQPVIGVRDAVSERLAARCFFVSAFAALICCGVGCTRDRADPATAARVEAESTASNQNAVAPTTGDAQRMAARPAAADPGTLPATRPAAEQALAWLQAQVRVPAADPNNPWALAHGLLAFGKDFQTRDGRNAVLVAAAFAEPQVSQSAGSHRYGFPVERAGKPVEPHPYLLAKTFHEIGVDRAFRMRASDGARLDLQRLSGDMRASVHEPRSGAEWHQAAWWLAALELDRSRSPQRTAQPDPELVHLRESALARLEADDAVIAAPSTADAFAATAPMGAAKRNKSHIYGHPCGGLHFVQAVLRAAAASGSQDFTARTQRQLRLLVTRARLERILYADMLREHPDASLLIAGQQLKFFGHVLETLALAEELGLLRTDVELASSVNTARRETTADLLGAVARLKQLHAYDRLAELAEKQSQLVLDLIGDGCHAVHGLRGTLDVLPIL